eukprot:JP445705.1.p2 GENE.JP445705.1~~JP445705.1.p2  ORF type:complete len:58 (-),score=5.28 JP445705.1:36-209(-)
MEKCVNYLFRVMDVNKDNRVSRDEFVNKFSEAIHDLFDITACIESVAKHVKARPPRE